MQVFFPGDDVARADLSRPVFFVAPAPVRRRVRTASADRTRSARWRAGTRRFRRMVNRPGPSPRPADPWAGWEDMGWIDETAAFAGEPARSAAAGA